MHQAPHEAFLRNNKNNFRVLPPLPRIPRNPFRLCGQPERQFKVNATTKHLHQQARHTK
jgi:hypothetical protein